MGKSKKFTIQIPKWTKERQIWVFAGREPVGYFCGGNFYIKTSRCNLCGKCCIVAEDWIFGAKSGETVDFNKDVLVCQYLEREEWNFGKQYRKPNFVWVCKAVNVPFGCCVDIPCGGKVPLGCSIKYKKVI